MTNLTLMVKSKVTSFKHTHLKFEAKNSYSSKVVAFTRNYTKIVKFQGQFDLEGQGQRHQFSNTYETFR